MDKVTQADRDAAADWFYGAQKDGVIRRGSKDDVPLVQAFAAHRRQAEEAMQERCFKLAADNRPSTEATDHWWGGYVEASQDIARAIRSMEVE